MPNNRKRLVGRVISDKMDKTITVAIELRKLHPIYKKVVIKTKKVLAHDETNAVPVGSLVRVVESKPMSKRKRWTVETILEAPDAAGMTRIENTDRLVEDNLSDVEVPEVLGAEQLAVEGEEVTEVTAANVVETDTDAETEEEKTDDTN